MKLDRPSLLAGMALLLSSTNALAEGARDTDDEPPPEGTQFRLKSDLSTLFSYPEQAVAEGMEGRTVVRLTVDAHGDAADCEIVESSGHALLDEESCRILLTSATFEPKRSAEDGPVAGHFHQAITWKLPEEAEPKGVPAIRIDYPEIALRNGWEGVVTYKATVGHDGRAKSCEVTESSGHEVLDDATCSMIIRSAIFHPALDEKGEPVEESFTGKINWKIPK